MYILPCFILHVSRSGPTLLEWGSPRGLPEEDRLLDFLFMTNTLSLATFRSIGAYCHFRKVMVFLPTLDTLQSDMQV